MTSRPDEGTATGPTYSTHINQVTGPVHTGSGNIYVSNSLFTAGVSTRDEFLSALRQLHADLEAARNSGSAEDTLDDTATEVQAALKEAGRETPNAQRIIGRLESAQKILTAGTGAITAAQKGAELLQPFLPTIQAAIDNARRLFT